MFDDATNLLHGKENAAICRVIPTLQLLELGLKSLDMAGCASVSTNKEALLTSLERRFHFCLESANRILGAILDAGTKLTFRNKESFSGFSEQICRDIFMTYVASALDQHCLLQPKKRTMSRRSPSLHEFDSQISIKMPKEAVQALTQLP